MRKLECFDIDTYAWIAYNVLNDSRKIECPIYSGNMKQLRNNRLLYQEQDDYFLYLPLLTSVITAHNMRTKVNKSLYVITVPSPSAKPEQGKDCFRLS